MRASSLSSAYRIGRGETVGVVAPGFAVAPAALEAGLARLERMGYSVRRGEHLRARCGYLAGSDEERAADLRAMLLDPEVRAVWFARGGYGTARILERVPWRGLRRAPKLLIGYSDLTALFNAAIQRSDLPCVYGPVVSELGDAGAYHAASLRRLLAGNPPEFRVRRSMTLAPGRGSGRLLGGNLTVLSHLCGTRYAPDLRGAVLFLEELGEELYRIDRMLTQLRLAGAFRRLAGVLLGSFDVPARRRFPPDRSLNDVLQEQFLPLGVPVVRGLPVGHVARRRSLPLGLTAEIDTAAGRVGFA